MDYDYKEAMKLDNQLCFPLYAAARRVTSLYAPQLNPLGLTYTQYLVFLVLWEKDGIPVGEICERLMLDNGTVSPLLKKMEKAGCGYRRMPGRADPPLPGDQREKSRHQQGGDAACGEDGQDKDHPEGGRHLWIYRPEM